MFHQRSMAGKRISVALLLMAGCSTQPVAPESPSVRDTVSAPHECVAAIGDRRRPMGERLDSEAIRVVNWNIQKGNDPDWVTDLDALDQSADLLILQEASPALDGLDEGDRHVAFAKGFKARRYQTGVMTLSSASPIAECDLVAREPWLGTRKATLVTEYGLTGTDETLLVINIHGVNFSIGARELAEQIRDAEAIIATHDGPVLFSGDFNTWRAGRTRLLVDAAARLGLSAIEFDADYRKRILGRPLDHIYTRGLVAVNATTHDVETSDHDPMTVDFRYETEMPVGRSAP